MHDNTTRGAAAQPSTTVQKARRGVTDDGLRCAMRKRPAVDQLFVECLDAANDVGYQGAVTRWRRVLAGSAAASGSRTRFPVTVTTRYLARSREAVHNDR